MRKARNTGLVTAASTLVLSALVGSSGALAENGQKSIDGASLGKKKVALEEILVTATKKGRAENVQDVPISITALGENQLDAMHFESIADVGYKFPNATLKESQFAPGQAFFFIRGVGVTHTAASMDPSVGVTVNGMPLGVNVGAVTETFDLESIEVLRGPQGTLFGRNTTGGVVVVRTKRPSGDFGFEVQGTVGDYNRRGIAVGIENGLIDDKLAGRLAVMYRDRDGYYDNAQGGDIGELRTKIIRPTLVFTPSDILDITLFTEYGKLDAGMPPVRNLFFPDTTYSQVFYTPPSDDLRKLDQNISGPNYTEWWHAITEVNWDVGPGQLTSVTGYKKVELEVTIDVDGSSNPVATIHFPTAFYEQQQFSQELRYAFDINDRTNLTTGLYYFDQSYEPHVGTDIFGGITPKHSFNNHDGYAVFAQGDIILAENWVLTLGGRYGKEDKDIRAATDAGGGCNVNAFTVSHYDVGCNYDLEDSESWSYFSPKVGLQWLINDTTQAYASWTKGFKSGGFNNEATQPEAAGPYDEETVEAYEIGLKTDLLNGRLRMNLAAFFNDYTDMQRFVDGSAIINQQVVGFNAVRNAGSAEVTGFEAEVTWLATERLTLGGNLGLMHNDIKEFIGLDVDGDTIPDPELAKENELAWIPEVTYNLAVAYDIPLSMGDLSLRGDYAYTGERPANDANSIDLDRFRSLNLSATFATSDGRYRISLFGKNVLDDVSLESAEKNPFFAFGNPNKPRTWGVEFTYNY